MGYHKNLTRRLLLALAFFDALQMTLHHGITPWNTQWQVAWAAILVPFGFFYLVYLGLALVTRGRWMVAAAIALTILRLGGGVVIHVKWEYMGEAFPRMCIGFAAMAAVIFMPWSRWDATLRRCMPAVSLAAIAAFTLFVTYSEEVETSYGPSTKAASGSPNLVLVSWDTLRADVLPMYGGTMLPMPNLQSWVDRSIQFNEAVAHAPITGPAHASMLTGLVPPEHGLRSNHLEILPGAEVLPRLPALLRDAGYQTGGFVGAYPLRNRFGIGDGFAVYDDRSNDSVSMRLRDFGYFDSAWVACFVPFIGKGAHAYTPGEVVQERAFEWLATVPKEDPSFLFLHLYDAHAPYSATGKYKEIADASFDKAIPKAGSDLLDDRQDIAAYRGDVAQLDDRFAEMMAVLEERDPGLQNTVILLTSDHGECFGEGGIHRNHVNSLFEATQHVPMFLYLPGGEGGGMQVEDTVTHSDILPTFLAAADLEIPGALIGRDALPLQLALTRKGLASKNRTVYMEAQQYTLAPTDKMRGWRSAEWKLIEREVAEGSDERTLSLFRYRLDEFLDLKDQHPTIAERLYENLQFYCGALEIIVTSAVQSSALDAASLDALGYGQAVEAN
ncbi:MAG: sulfatase [Planctomycetota bacterium]|jgi:arylsulfatase A-like enzyme